MKLKSLKVNTIWNFLYTGSNIIFPLITAPYVTRVLGANNLGEVDFARAFVQWFTIFGSFGILTYGVRAISQVRDNNQKMNKVFSELLVISAITSFLSVILYLLLIFRLNVLSGDRLLFFVMQFSIILNAVNIDWFYQGIEEYDFITIRNFIIRIISLIFIFIFIKNPDDYILYGLISILGTGLSGVLNIFHSRKYVKFTLKNLKISQHFRSLFTFFLITFVINIYSSLDRTVLGFVDTSSSVAFFTRAKMVTGLAGTIAVSISSVSMPRASLYIKTDISKYKKLINEVPKYMLLLTIPITVGVIFLAPEIMFILGGVEFQNVSSIVSLIAIVSILSSLSYFLQHLILIPTDNEQVGLVASIISSIVSIVLNFYLIPKYSYIGAGLALLGAEFTAFIIRYLYIKKYIYNFIRFTSSSVYKYLIAAIFMIPTIFLMKNHIQSQFYTFILSALICSGIYFLTLLILKEEIILKYFTTFTNNFVSDE